MPTLVDKAETVELLRHEFQSLAEVGSTVSDDQWDKTTCLPGWSVRDVFSHVIGTESMLAGEPAPVVEVSHLGHMKNAVAEGNELWVESMRSLGGAELLDRFEGITSRRLAALDLMTQADFDAPSWTPAGRDETYGRFMRIRHYDCFMHEHDIRDALGMPVETRGARSGIRPRRGGYRARLHRWPAGVDARRLTGADRSDRTRPPCLPGAGPG